MGTSLKEKRLRLILDEYRVSTNEGGWITPLNPDNISILFTDTPLTTQSICGNKIILNKNIEAKYLFPCYIKELWHIKQKREHRWKYWFYKIFMPNKINDSANEKEELAKNWLYS